MNWKDRIEAQIAWLNKQPAFSGHKPIADTMQALLDVAVGFETDVEESLHYMYPETFKALRKLREVGDE